MTEPEYASEAVMNELERLRSVIRSLAAERDDLAAEVIRLRTLAGKDGTNA